MSDLPPPNATGDAPSPSWFNRKVGPLPVWSLIVSAIVAVAVIGNAGSGDDAANEADTELTTDTTSSGMAESDGEESAASEPDDSETDEMSEPGGDSVDSDEADRGDSMLSSGGTRDEPVQVGKAFVFEVSTFGDADGSVWEATVTGPGMDITAAVAEENMFNDPPVDGNIFYGVPFRIVLVDAGKEPLAPWLNISWDVFGPSALKIYDPFESSCGVIPNAFDDTVEVFVGGAVEGMMCFSLPQAEVDAGPLLSAEPAGERIYLATAGDPAEVEPSSFLGDVFVPDGSGDAGTRRSPTAVGDALAVTVSTFGDADGSVWEAVVTGPGSDITDAVMAENMFNDPPAEGNVFYGVPFQLTLVEAGKEPLAPWLNVSWDVFGPASLKIFSGTSSSCGVIPNAFDDLTEVFIGGSVAGQLCFSIPVADVDAGPMVSTDQNDVRYYLATR